MCIMDELKGLNTKTVKQKSGTGKRGRAAGSTNKLKTFWVTRLDAFGNFITDGSQIIEPTIEVTCAKKNDLRSIIYDNWNMGEVFKQFNPDITTKAKGIEFIEVDSDTFVKGRYLITAYLDENGDYDMYWIADDIEKVHKSKFDKLLATPGKIKKIS